MPHGAYFILRMTFSALSPTSANHPGERIQLARDTNIELHFNPYLISLGYGSQTPCSCLGFPLCLMDLDILFMNLVIFI